MRTSRTTRKAFYVILTVLFIFSLHQNGVFNTVEKFVISSQSMESNSAILLSAEEFRPPIHGRNATCTPTQKVVFLKTHKTASSTAASIIERYGYKRNFTFAVSNTALKFYHGWLFQRLMVKETSRSVDGWTKENGYDMLTNHARFNKREMDAVVHNAKYITIIRNPIDQLESAFGYFDLGQPMGFKGKYQLEEFMKDPHKYFGAVKKGYWQFARNNQLFDLGFNHEQLEDPDSVRNATEQLGRNFDLVMLSEYFDHSLILLRRLLCWEMTDILYISKAIRSASRRQMISDELRGKVAEWNKADMQLYRYFNESLWRKIREYGPQFIVDLNEFREKLKQVTEECINPAKLDKRDTREDKFVLKSDAPQYCTELLMGDVEYTRFIQQRMWDRGILLPNPNLMNK